jgi:L-cysteine:1D-myo-inositol 2-amino-2-deoxy-alpha-D-glucopyranoside ligase
VFARCYVHSGMVRLDGEKMSKSRGNLVFVSRLLAAGVDPMAIRLAILAHHYAHDWDWTQEGIAAAADRLARWRGAVALASAAVGPLHAEVPPARDVLAAVRDRLADDLDAPGALAAVDSWAAAVVTAAGSSMPGPGGPVSGPGGSTSGAGGLAPAAGASADLELASAGRLVSDLVDALLGIAL